MLPALIRRFHGANESRTTEVVCRGTNMPLGELMYVDDLADACVLLLDTYSGNEMVNEVWLYHTR